MHYRLSAARAWGLSEIKKDRRCPPLARPNSRIYNKKWR
jgi:hypothetical protein